MKSTNLFTILKGLFKSLLTILQNLLASIFQNGFYILWTLLFPIIIYNLELGQDILTIAFDDRYLKFSFIDANWFLLPFVYTLMMYNIWVAPTLIIWIWHKLTGKNKFVLFALFVTQYNSTKENIPIRYFSLLPILLFGINCITKSKPIIFSISLIIIFGLTLLVRKYQGVLKIILLRIFQFTYTYFSKRIFKTQSNCDLFNLHNVLYQGIWYLFFAIFFAIYPSELASYKEIVFGVLFILMGYWHFLCMAIIEDEEYDLIFIENKSDDPIGESYYVTNRNFYLLIIFSTLLLILFLVMNQMHIIYKLSPIVVGIGVFNFYLLLFDLIYKSNMLLLDIYKKRYRKKFVTLKLFFTTLAWIFFAYIFIFNFHSHKIFTYKLKEKRGTNAPKRLTLDEYFKRWLISNPSNTIVLVAAQGGGNRAGAWSTLSINYLNEQLHDKLRKNIFALSTVSGSTMGVNMVLGQWHLQKFDTTFKPEYSKFSEILYTKNYVSGALWGLLIKDEIVGMLSAKGNDRNYDLQQEEILAFQEMIDSTYQGDTSKKEQLKTLAKQYFMNDFLLNHDTLVCSSPLFLINTAITQTGERGVISPVMINNFSKARDVYQGFLSSYFKKDSHHIYGLPQITCVNQSQAFPYISAYNYIDSIGNLIDGGLYENSGSLTISEVYQALKRYCVIHQIRKKFIILSLLNSSTSADRDDQIDAHTGTIRNSFAALVSSPFSGHQNYWDKELETIISGYNRLDTFIQPRDTLFRILLGKRIALNKVIPKYILIDSMIPEMRDSSKKAFNYLNLHLK